MKLRGDARPDKVMSEFYGGREKIKNPWIESNRLIATDGRHLVCYQIELEDGESPAQLPIDSRIFEDQDNNPEDPYKLVISPDGSIKVPDQGVAFDRPNQNEFANYKNVCPDLSGPGKVIISLAVDPELLTNVLLAMGRKEKLNGRVEIVFEVEPSEDQDENFPKRLINKGQAMIVNTIYDGENDFSLVMPCRVDGKRFQKIDLVAQIGKANP